MQIEKGKRYKIKESVQYFKEKYNMNPILIEIEDLDINIWSGGWGEQAGNPACRLYAIRIASTTISAYEPVWYGHVCGMGELVAEYELEEIVEDNK